MRRKKAHTACFFFFDGLYSFSVVSLVWEGKQPSLVPCFPSIFRGLGLDLPHYVTPVSFNMCPPFFFPSHSFFHLRCRRLFYVIPFFLSIYPFFFLLCSLFFGKKICFIVFCLLGRMWKIVFLLPLSRPARILNL